ncbi:MAG TPA: NDP-sugar synthase [Actinomycetota bacterium]|nr:NDP-sugar synthase [Actinomycetota bacterium]
MKAVLIVGGEGTRLRPITCDTHKSLVPVANRTILEHVLAHLSRHGVREAILTTGYLGGAFEAFPPERSSGVRLTVVQEEKPLDTCGAVRNVADCLDDTFFVLNGDILTDLDLTAMLQFHRERRAAGTISLTRVQDPSSYGLVPVDPEGRIQQFIEKPRADQAVSSALINAGTYILEPETLERVPSGVPWSFERNLFPDLLSGDAGLYGFESASYWLDLGTPQKYLTANLDVLGGKVGERPPGTRDESGTWVDEGATVDPAARVRGPAALGAGSRLEAGSVVYPRSCLGSQCVVGPGAIVEESVLHDEVVVEEGAVVERSILCGGVRVGAGTRISDAIIGSGVRVGPGNELRAGIRLWPGLDVPEASIRF